MASGLIAFAGSSLDSPAFAPLAPWLARLPAGALAGTHLPGCGDLNALFAAAPTGPPFTASGQRLRCVTPESLAGLPDEAYEARVWRSGEIATRPDNWHDLFNALTWCVFPETKRVINAHHAARIAQPALSASGASLRGTARDVLTLFDEDGLVVPCSDAGLATMLSGFRWKELFVDHRSEVQRCMDFCIVGHALYDKMRAPFFGVTAKALLVTVDDAYFALAAEERAMCLDQLIAGRLRDPAFLQSTRNLSPLPVLGIPGWCADNEASGYYDDTRQFRPGRRGNVR